MIPSVDTETRAHFDYAVSLLRQLVQTPSITGDESAVQNLLRRELESLHLSIDQWQPDAEKLRGHPAYSDDGLPLENRTCLVAKWKGSGGGRSLILNGHVDVVPPGDLNAWDEDPWSGVVNGGKLFGRGSCDMKGGLVTALLAISVLQRMGVQPSGDVFLQFVIGEETGGVGTLASILRGYTADAAIILEPTELHLCPVGAGAASFRLHLRGLAAHGSMRLHGVSAIEKFEIIHQALLQFEAERHHSFRHSLYDGMLAAPISIGKIQAGDWPSSVPDLLIAEGRFGILPGERIQQARTKFEEMVFENAKRDEWLQSHPPRVEWFEGQFEPAETPLDSELLSVLRTTHHDTTGSEPAMHGVPYGSDLRFFTNYAKIPALLYGPGSVEQAHSANEFIELEQMLYAARVVALMIARWCGI